MDESITIPQPEIPATPEQEVAADDVINFLLDKIAARARQDALQEALRFATSKTAT